LIVKGMPVSTRFGLGWSSFVIASVGPLFLASLLVPACSGGGAQSDGGQNNNQNNNNNNNNNDSGNDSHVPPPTPSNPNEGDGASDAGGDSSVPAAACADLLSCIDGCSDQACSDTCYNGAPPGAQVDFVNSEYYCAAIICGEACAGGGPACADCYFKSCGGPFSRCHGTSPSNVEVPSPISKACSPPNPVPAGCLTTPPAKSVWAKAVVSKSTQYSASLWSADSVIGPPDVYPCHADVPGTWAPATAGDQPEQLVIDLGSAVTVASVMVVETNARSAISEIALSADGSTFNVVATPTPAVVNDGDACIHNFVLGADGGATTQANVRYVRVKMASGVLTDFEEIDSIGVVTP
jgi:hypothetical protein